MDDLSRGKTYKSYFWLENYLTAHWKVLKFLSLMNSVKFKSNLYISEVFPI